MNDLLAALLLGIIEGITEFLPISSTGHLLIAEHWLGARSDLFNIAIQAGAILAVVLIYWQRLWQLLVGLGQKAHRDYALKLALAFGVTGALGLVVKKLGFELPETLAPIAWALLIGGFVILAVEAIDARRADLPDSDPDAIGWGTAVLVGLAQVLAGVFPGTSRSAAAIFAALLFGRSSRVAATEFAFLVGIPTMFAATGYELLHTLKDGGGASEDWTALAVAFVASALTAFAAVKWLLRYIQTHRFTVFAWYRIVLGAALLVWLGLAPAVVPGAAAAPVSAVAQAGLPADANNAVPTASGAASDAIHDAALPGWIATRSGLRHAQAQDPAAAALLREFAQRKYCNQARMMRLYFSGPSGDSYMDLLSGKDVPPETRALSLKNTRQVFDRLDRADRECAPLAEALLDGSSYDLALRAAELGDREAASCFISGAFAMPPAMHKRPEVLARFRLDAARLIERGIAHGDWRMVSAAKIVYADTTGWGAPSFEAPFYTPGLRLAASIGATGGDPMQSYRMSRLLQLGSGSAEEAQGYAQEASAAAARLTPARRQAADTWANLAFARQFQRRPMREDERVFPCGEDLLAAN